MTIQVLVPTHGKSEDEIKRLIGDLGIRSDVIISNQADEEKEYQISLDGHEVKVVFVKEVGVSKNRNRLLSMLDADIGLFTDDDCPLDPNYIRYVEESFSHGEEAVLFSRKSEKKQFDSVIFPPKKATKFRDISTIGGPGLAIRKDAISKYDLSFDETIGVPNYVCLGEDSLFGKSMIDKRVNLWTSDNVIFYVLAEDESTSSYSHYDERYFYSVGYISSIIHSKAKLLIYIKKCLQWKRRIGHLFNKKMRKALRNGIKQNHLRND